MRHGSQPRVTAGVSHGKSRKRHDGKHAHRAIVRCHEQPLVERVPHIVGQHSLGAALMASEPVGLYVHVVSLEATRAMPEQRPAAYQFHCAHGYEPPAAA